MSGYKLRMMLYSSVQTFRDVTIPSDITFKQLHNLVQNIFGFTNSHIHEFNVPAPFENGANLNDIVKTIDMDVEDNIKISEIFDEYDILQYIYDFGDNWEIVLCKLEDVYCGKNTATIIDYDGKYNPMEDMGGIDVFEEIMECADDEEEMEYVLSDYGLTKNDLKKMDFEKKYKKGSKIIIN